MGLLDGLEKLITEHGSAAILKERIKLAEDKYAALEKRNVEVTERNGKLEAENAELKATVEALAPSHDEEHDEDATLPVLQHVMQRPGTTVADVAASFGSGREGAQYLLGQLQEAGLIDAAYSYIEPTSYHLTQEGRGYLAKRGLLK